MKYMLFICWHDDIEISAEDAAKMGPDTDRWVDETGSVRLMGNQLAEAKAGKLVRVRDGRVSVTDGPFAETKEQIAGFDIIECSNLEEALEVASKHPVARHGMVEVRPFWTE